MRLMLAVDIDHPGVEALVHEAVLWARRTGATVDIAYVPPPPVRISAAATAELREVIEIEVQRQRVAELAEVAALSRSAFAARFTEVVGESAMRYLTRWRLQVARSALRECDEPIGIVGERLGYRSEAAFCRAYKREFGVSPGADRRAAPVLVAAS